MQDGAFEKMIGSEGIGEPVSAAMDALKGADALLVHVEGKPAGILTRQDVLGHLADQR